MLKGEREVADLVSLLSLAAFFLICGWLVEACERLKG
jgi:hypothetical protein